MWYWVVCVGGGGLPHKLSAGGVTEDSVHAPDHVGAW